MSAFLSFLGHLTALDWLFIGIAWVLVAFALGTFTGCVMKRADEVQRAMYPPPAPAPITPPFTQAIPDASWFAGMPCDVLPDDAVHSLFDELIYLEGLS